MYNSLEFPHPAQAFAAMPNNGRFGEAMPLAWMTCMGAKQSPNRAKLTDAVA
jgi:hypothetical protein